MTLKQKTSVALLGGAFLASLAVSCASTPQPQTAATQASAAETEYNALLKFEMRKDSIRRESELSQVQATAALAPQAQEGITMRLTPCKTESYDNDKEMRGLGVSNPEKDQQIATRAANQAALIDMASRFAGIIQSTVQTYDKDARLSSGQRINEHDKDALAQVVGEKVINKYAQRVCLEHAQNELGAWIAYEALKIPLDVVKPEILAAVEEEAGRLQLGFDKKLFGEAMEKEMANYREQMKNAQKNTP